MLVFRWRNAVFILFKTEVLSDSWESLATLIIAFG